MTGKGLKKINRRGQGPEEYILPFNVHLNKEEDEMFVNDGPSSKIQVYDLDGNYKITTKTATPVLVFSYVGYQTKETHATENIVNIVLEDGAQELGEVVVTALGIKRSEKAIKL